MDLNPNKTALQNLFDLINSSNLTQYDESYFTFSHVTVISGPNGLNTSVRANAVPGSGYTGYETLRYRRVDLSVYEPVLTFVHPTIYDYETFLRSSLQSAGVIADQVDLGPAPTHDEETGRGITSISAKSDSLVYIGNVQVVLIDELLAASTYIPDIVRNTKLAGFSSRNWSLSDLLDSNILPGFELPETTDPEIPDYAVYSSGNLLVSDGAIVISTP